MYWKISFYWSFKLEIKNQNKDQEEEEVPYMQMPIPCFAVQGGAAWCCRADYGSRNTTQQYRQPYVHALPSLLNWERLNIFWASLSTCPSTLGWITIKFFQYKLNLLWLEFLLGLRCKFFPQIATQEPYSIPCPSATKFE